MYCVQCGFTLENDICPSCHNSAISLREVNAYPIYCWNCGNGLDDDEEYCGNCQKSRDQIVKHLSYTKCQRCDNDIDPAYECPYCNKFVETISISYIQGDWKFINKNECPFNLSPKEYKHDNKTGLNYKRSNNGYYSVSTQPQINLKYRYKNKTLNSDIAERVIKQTGYKRLNEKRIEKLRRTMPTEIPLKINGKGELKFDESILNEWFIKSKKLKI